MTLDDIADELYALPPEEFTTARAEAVRRVGPGAREDVRALRRPTTAAYVVNTLVRKHHSDVEALVDLGGALRAAMSGTGDVRKLAEDRRSAIAALVRSAPEAAGRVLTAAVEQEVAATLEAASADPGLAAQVLSGRLIKALRYAGFGTTADLDDAVATPLPQTGSRTRPAAGNRATAEPAPPSTEPSKELTRLRSRVLELAGAADDAQRRYEVASRAAAEARRRLEQAEKERADAHKAAKAAHREAESARRDLGRLERS